MKDNELSFIWVFLLIYFCFFLSATCTQIGRLKKLVGRKGFSNNPAAEISDVMKLFEGDMAGLQKDISSLQRWVRRAHHARTPAEANIDVAPKTYLFDRKPLGLDD